MIVYIVVFYYRRIGHTVSTCGLCLDLLHVCFPVAVQSCDLKTEETVVFDSNLYPTYAARTIMASLAIVGFTGLYSLRLRQPTPRILSHQSQSVRPVIAVIRVHEPTKTLSLSHTDLFPEASTMLWILCL